jgi:hypothetical protein
VHFGDIASTNRPGFGKKPQVVGLADVETRLLDKPAPSTRSDRKKD